MGLVYVFKVALKHRKGAWRSIEIHGDQTLGDFDGAIRKTFGHDTWDHMSEFYSGQIWNSGGFGEIMPGGGGSGADVLVNELGLSEGDKLEYVYDFGGDIQHVLTLEKVVEQEAGVEYPRVVAMSKPRYRYCVACKEKGKKTVATWFCIECSEKPGKDMYLCEDCLAREHEDHYAEEIVY